MGEFQEKKAETGIRRRNTLHRRRDEHLTALRELHSGELADDVARVTNKVAHEIVRDYWKRDAERAPLDVGLISEAIKARNGVRRLHQTERDFIPQITEARARLKRVERLGPFAKEGQGRGDVAKRYRVALMRSTKGLAKRLKRRDGLRQRIAEKEVKFFNAVRVARCEDDLYGDALEQARRTARAWARKYAIVGAHEESPGSDEGMSTERWHIPTMIWRRFGGALQPDGLRDARVLLDPTDEAMAYTLFVRAAVSPDGADDLIAAALRDRETDELRSRSSGVTKVRGRTTHEHVSRVLSPSLGGRLERTEPPSFTDVERAVILDSDNRLEWLLAAGEEAAEALDLEMSVGIPEEAPVVTPVTQAPEVTPVAQMPAERATKSQYRAETLRRLIRVLGRGEVKYLTSTVLLSLGPLPEPLSAQSFKTYWRPLRMELTRQPTLALRIAPDASGHRTHPAEFLETAEQVLKEMLAELPRKGRGSART